MRKLYSRWVRFYWPAIIVLAVQCLAATINSWHEPAFVWVLWGTLDVFIIGMNTLSRKHRLYLEQRIEELYQLRAQMEEEFERRRRNGL